MTTFNFNRFGKNLGTRQLGEQVRNELLQTINSNDMTILDFEGVNIVANSFADECIGKLLLHMSLNELKSRTTFRSVNDTARVCIATAIKRRNMML
ncbi:STAS-like domain-containing protein [Prevotella sp. PINT]|uniref:STAS-like domain-containing protein n=1 Tax=Palleniella intestinalis TaxID=2736291 RepID=UPI00155426B2|nr:STAS-like domain-containing protein [Palleniella intestinalis]NPD83109.1 STAS-like domain-containing protein [Palleniella intestinalis]